MFWLKKLNVSEFITAKVPHNFFGKKKGRVFVYHMLNNLNSLLTKTYIFGNQSKEIIENTSTKRIASLQHCLG